MPCHRTGPHSMKSTPKLACLCQICTCGRHSCSNTVDRVEPRPLWSLPVTEYHKSYRPVKVAPPPPQPFRPAHTAPNRDTPVDGMTMYGTHYVQHPLPGQQPKTPAFYRPPSQQLDCTTIYQEDYRPKPVQRQVSFTQPDSIHTTGEPLDSSTVYRQTYLKWDVQPASPAYSKNGGYSKPTVPFDGRTTVGTDYTGRSSTRALPFLPEDSLVKPNVPIDLRTTTTMDYRPMAMSPTRSMRPDEAPAVRKGQFNGDTTHRHAFPWPKVSKRAQPCRPPSDTSGSREPMAFHTTHMQEFQEWPVQRRPPQRCEPWSATKAPFCSGTTFKEDYRHWSIERTRSTRPTPTASLASAAAVDSSTSYKDAYQLWSLQPSQGYKPESQYCGAREHFNGSTTYRDNYRGEYANRPPTFKEHNSSVVHCGPMDLMTTHRDDYRGNKINSCPATKIVLLDSHRSDLDHQYYVVAQ